jgi:hypothetical protein
MEQLTRPAVDQDDNRSEQRPEDGRLSGKRLEPAASGAGNETRPRPAAGRLEDKPFAGDQAAWSINNRHWNCRSS